MTEMYCSCKTCVGMSLLELHRLSVAVAAAFLMHWMVHKVFF